MKTNKQWTETEIKQLAAMRKLGLSAAEIGNRLGRTRKSIETRLVRERETSLSEKHTSICDKAYPAPAPEQVAASIDAFEADKGVLDYWRKRAKSLEQDLAAAVHTKLAEEILAERVLEMAPVAYTPPPAVPMPHEDHEKHGSPQSAVLLFSDTHIGAVVKPEQTLGLGEYSFGIFLRRLARLERSIRSILKDHTATEVPEIVIAMLGDMLDGALVHSAECGQLNTLLAQFYSGGHAIAQFFRNLSTIAPLRIYTTVGNHTRWGTQHRMPTKNRNSNFDMLLYCYVQALLRDVPTIQMELNWQPFATFDVQGCPFYCLHGDGIRGGDKILGLPAHGMGRMVSTTTQLFSRAQKDTPAYYCMGHLHRPIEIPHAKGAVIVNGAFPGIDGYALAEYFNSAHPIQKFWLMHPKFGRSATYDLRLDLGDGTPHHYQLPTEFACQ